MVVYLGWDIGGVHTKVAALDISDLGERRVRTAFASLAIWREKDRLTGVIRALRQRVAPPEHAIAAVTMTAELADVFATKREGVRYVLRCMVRACPQDRIVVLNTSGAFRPLADAMRHPLDFAATNWLATALWAAATMRTCIVLDIGSTTTDIIPVRHGRVDARGRTDLDRLMCGELVYTGVIRTPVAALVRNVPLRGQRVPVAAEFFAVTGDVYLVLQRISPGDYTGDTPDGRGKTRKDAARRLARMVCADPDQLSMREIVRIAWHVYRTQVTLIARAVRRILRRLGDATPIPILPLGTGRFLAHDVAQRLRLPICALPTNWPEDTARIAPCMALAELLIRRDIGCVY